MLRVNSGSTPSTNLRRTSVLNGENVSVARKDVADGYEFLLLVRQATCNGGIFPLGNGHINIGGQLHPVTHRHHDVITNLNVMIAGSDAHPPSQEPNIVPTAEKSTFE